MIPLPHVSAAMRLEPIIKSKFSRFFQQPGDICGVMTVVRIHLNNIIDVLRQNVFKSGNTSAASSPLVAVNNMNSSGIFYTKFFGD